MSKKNTAPRLGNALGGVSSLLASLVCIFIGLVVGFVVLLVLGGITMTQDGSTFSMSELLTTTWSQGFRPILEGIFRMMALYRAKNAPTVY